MGPTAHREGKVPPTRSKGQKIGSFLNLAIRFSDPGPPSATHGEEELERCSLALEQALDNHKEDVAGQVEALHDVWKGAKKKGRMLHAP